jgi:predicted phosphoribosyltransferase
MKYRVFKDRQKAGQLLADAVAQRHFSDPVVLALPRGGVPVAAEVAAKLNAPLDIILVRKIGAPLQPELALGAVIDGDAREIVLNPDVVSETGVSDEYIRREADRQIQIIEERRKQWIGDKPRAQISGKTAILVDDGIATGATMRASVHAVRRQAPKAVIVATPVAALETVETLKGEADDVICLEAPMYLGAIGFYYRNFSQISDEEVVETLAKFRTAVAAEKS